MFRGIIMGQYLYHYTTIETLTNHILVNKKIKANHLKNVNDPQEIHKVNYSETYGGGKFISPNLRLEKVKKFRDIESKVYRSLHLICFSQDTNYTGIPDNMCLYNKGYYLPNMWAHYGNKQNGVCLCFDKDQISRHIKNNEGSSVIYDGEVKYTIEPINNSFSPDTFPLEDIETKGWDLILSDYKNRLSCKTPHWSSEFEYRFLLEKKNCDMEDLLISFKDSLKEIIIGMNYKLTSCDPIYKFCISNGTKLKQLGLDSHTRIPTEKVISEALYYREHIQFLEDLIRKDLNLDFSKYENLIKKKLGEDNYRFLYVSNYIHKSNDIGMLHKLYVELELIHSISNVNS